LFPSLTEEERRKKKEGGFEMWIQTQPRLLILWVLEVINSWKICGAKENIG
jgi:hypothetical protein